jgi:hypothetical protein
VDVTDWTLPTQEVYDMKSKTMEDTVFLRPIRPNGYGDYIESAASETVAQIIDLQNLHMTVCKHHWRV